MQNINVKKTDSIINKKMNILEFNKNIASDIIISYLNDMNKYNLFN